MKFYVALLSLLMFVALGAVVAQQSDGSGSDTATEDRVDNSSAFQDSIKYDDMDPIFFEAEEEEAAPEPESPQISTGLIIGIVAIVVIIIFFLIRRSAKKS